LTTRNYKRANAGKRLNRQLARSLRCCHR
jgi:hypothetical protein